MNLEQFINDFLSLNPHPSKEQVEWLAFSLGISDLDKPEFIETTLSASAKKCKLCALTETDNLLINDGDNLNNEHSIGNQQELSQDGIIEETSIEGFLYHNEKL